MWKRAMHPYIEKLKQHIADNPPNFGDGDSGLGLLYECFNENNPYDNEQIKSDFNELYQQMNGMPLREMDKIIYPVCKLCRDHEKAGVMPPDFDVIVDRESENCWNDIDIGNMMS